jgi:hypothetical protein
MTTTTHSHKPWTDKGGHVRSAWGRGARQMISTGPDAGAPVAPSVGRRQLSRSLRGTSCRRGRKRRSPLARASSRSPSDGQRCWGGSCRIRQPPSRRVSRSAGTGTPPGRCPGHRYQWPPGSASRAAPASAAATAFRRRCTGHRDRSLLAVPLPIAHRFRHIVCTLLEVNGRGP